MIWQVVTKWLPSCHQVISRDPTPVGTLLDRLGDPTRLFGDPTRPFGDFTRPFGTLPDHLDPTRPFGNLTRPFRNPTRPFDI